MAGFLIFHRGRDTGRIRTVRVSGPLRRRAAERQGRVRQRIRREGSGTGNATADFRNTASGEHPAEGAPLPHAAAAREKGFLRISESPDIFDACADAVELAHELDCGNVLFSPSSKSYDNYTSYAERGRAFDAAVRRLMNEK